jgi:LCP family protein required for cell wall assembly
VEAAPAAPEPLDVVPAPAVEAPPPDEDTAGAGGGAGDEDPVEAGTSAGAAPPDDATGEVAEAVPTRRGPGWAKALIAMGTVLVMLAGGGVVALRILADRYDHAVTRAPLIDPAARAQLRNGRPVAAGVSGPLNFLLLGSDARINIPSMGQRSDSIILVHVPASLDRAYLISIPRDLRVHIPPDPATNFGGAHEKINGAFQYGGGGIGGYQLLSRTLNQLTGVRFDGAGIVDFDGFKTAVGILGGVDLCVDVRTESIHTHVVYEPGCQHLQDWQALDFVRQRELLPNDDYDRERHQQQFLKAIFATALHQGVATNPIKLDQFIRAVGGAMTVDTNGVSLADLVFGLRNVKPTALVGIRMPSVQETIGGIAYVLPTDETPALYRAIVSDTLDTWVVANQSWVNPI